MLHVSGAEGGCDPVQGEWGCGAGRLCSGTSRRLCEGEWKCRRTATRNARLPCPWEGRHPQWMHCRWWPLQPWECMQLVIVSEICVTLDWDRESEGPDELLLRYCTSLLYCVTVPRYCTSWLYYVTVLRYCTTLPYYATVLRDCTTLLYFVTVLRYCTTLPYYATVLRYCTTLLYFVTAPRYRITLLYYVNLLRYCITSQKHFD